MKVLGMRFVLVACFAIVTATVGCKDDKKSNPATDSGTATDSGQTTTDSGAAKDSGQAATDSGTPKDSGTTPVDAGGGNDSGTGADAGGDAG